MSSLFNDGDCGCNSDNADKGKNKCKGCVCSVLRQLANRKPGDFCQAGRAQRILVVNKGTSTPLFLMGSTEPTEFTVVDFDPDTCCAILSFEVPSINGGGDNRERRTYITDCRSIAGIACIED